MEQFNRKASISAIIPAYNRCGMLKDALQSVITQTHLPGEIIVVDDGSTDATKEMIATYFPQVNYIWQENRGVSAARNHGIAAARGEWLAFLDSDDQWLPEKLQMQWQHLQQSFAAGEERWICQTDEIWFRKGERVNPRKKHRKHGGWIFRKCLPLCVISPSSVLMHRRVFAAAGTFDETLPACEDYDLWLRVCARFPVLFVNMPLILKFGGHKGQLSRKHWGMDRFRVQALLNILKQEIVGETERQAVIKMVHKKLAILQKGGRKRNNSALLNWIDDVKKQLPADPRGPQ